MKNPEEPKADEVLTIGYSNHSADRFLELLRQNAVTAIADVRSQPYSRFNPAFSRKELKEMLRAEGIAYVFLGRELGARSDDPACYAGGRVLYRKLAEKPLFREGLARVIKGAQTHRLALMCAEKDPLACHRTILISRELEAAGTSVSHIHASGDLEPHPLAVARLLELLGMRDRHLFKSPEDLIADAYAEQEAKIAYVDPDLRVEAS